MILKFNVLIQVGGILMVGSFLKKSKRDSHSGEHSPKRRRSFSIFRFTATLSMSNYSKLLYRKTVKDLRATLSGEKDQHAVWHGFQPSLLVSSI